MFIFEQIKRTPVRRRSVLVRDIGRQPVQITMRGSAYKKPTVCSSPRTTNIIL